MELSNVIAVRDTKTVYRDGDKCIKVFNESYKKSQVLNEALNQSLVEETGVSMPGLLEVLMIDGKWSIVSEYVSGKTLAQLILENPEKKREYIEKLVDIQREIQSKSCPMLRKLKDKMNDKICQTSLNATTRYDLHARLESMPKHSKLCHGDLDTTNVLITDNGGYSVLDWSHATQGNASADAARTYLCFRLDGDVEGAEMYLDIFCEKNGTDKKYVQKWMPIVAASRLVKCAEKERDFLLAWADGEEYRKVYASDD